MVSLSFYGLSMYGILGENMCYRFFAIFPSALLQSLRLFDIFLLNYCSAGVTELCPILVLCDAKPYLNTLPNKTLSSYITGLFPILMPYRSIPYLSTIPKYNQSFYLTKLYPILILYRTITNPNKLPNFNLSWYLAEVPFHIALSQNSIRRRKN